MKILDTSFVPSHYYCENGAMSWSERLLNTNWNITYSQFSLHFAISHIVFINFEFYTTLDSWCIGGFRRFEDFGGFATNSSKALENLVSQWDHLYYYRRILPYWESSLAILEIIFELLKLLASRMTSLPAMLRTKATVPENYLHAAF